MENSFPELNLLINNEQRLNYKNYDLSAMQGLLKLLDNPEKKIKTIHIAGTNGKGTVANLLNQIFIDSGYKTGLYTSPHLLAINERVTINNKKVSNPVLERYLYKITLLKKKLRVSPTFFDVLTVIAFKYFYDQQVDLAIIETGLGGELDSTNVISPLCSLITKISLDHSHILGKSLKSITLAKSGIIKKNIPVITTNTSPQILKIISLQAVKKKSPLFILGSNFKTKNLITQKNRIRFDYKDFSKNQDIKNIFTNLQGEWQVSNMATAIFTTLSLREEFPKLRISNIRKSLRKIKISGRLEILSKTPLIIFDLAHNEEAIKNNLAYLKKIYFNKELFLIFSIMKDKNFKKIIPDLIKSKIPIIFYELDGHRSLKIENIKNKNKFRSLENCPLTLKKTLSSLPQNNSVFVFLGSARLYKIAKDIAASRPSLKN